MPKIPQQYRNPFTCDGVTKTFNTTHKFIANSTLVFLNGVLHKGYTEGSDHKSVTLTAAPANTWQLEIVYTIDNV